MVGEDRSQYCAGCPFGSWRGGVELGILDLVAFRGVFPAPIGSRGRLGRIGHGAEMFLEMVRREDSDQSYLYP